METRAPRTRRNVLMLAVLALLSAAGAFVSDDPAVSTVIGPVLACGFGVMAVAVAYFDLHGSDRP